jgi:cytochrome subunit of sulfide dehydrogenase
MVGAAASSHAENAEYADRARDLAATCANCHGTDGRSVGGLDKLAGAPTDRMLEQMMAFRSGDKPATIMHQITRGYTEAELELIANYFAALK